MMAHPYYRCHHRMLPVLLLLAAVALCCPGRALQSADEQQQQPSDAEFDAVIVGAGMAGISTARTLADAGLRVLVLEARDRAGGRLASMLVPGGVVDEGAMWIHEGQAGNPLYDLTQQLGLAISPQQNYNSFAIHAPDGSRSNSLSSLPVYRQLYSTLVPQLNAMRSTPGTPDAPLSSVYSDFLEQAAFTPAQLGQSNIFMHVKWQALLNGNVTQLSSLRLGDAKSIPAVDVMLQQGFPAMTDALGQGLDIQYSTVVTRIEHDVERVTVVTDSGVAYTASHVILTVPLGLLKQGSIAYSPPLPQEKTGTIAAIGYGVLDKAIFVFNTTFWDASVDFLLREMPDWSGRWAVFLNYQKLFPAVKALVAIHVADTALALEQMSDAAVVGEGMAVLRQMYGASVPDPIQTRVTRWAADPFSRGSYSFFAVGNPKNITAALAAPVGRLLFAGEATSDKPATVLGAHLSGLREAERVLGTLDGGTLSYVSASPAAEAFI